MEPAHNGHEYLSEDNKVENNFNVSTDKKVLEYLLIREKQNLIKMRRDNNSNASEKDAPRYALQEPENHISDHDPIGIIRDHYPSLANKSFLRLLHFLKNPQKYIAAGKTAALNNNFLLHGPPGSGKTYLAELIHKEFQLPFLYINAAQFADKYIGEGAKNISAAFSIKDPLDRTVLLLIDEIDAIGTQRSDKTHEEHRSNLITLLTEIHKNSRNLKLLVLATTNDKNNLDRALISRFKTRAIEFNHPNEEERTHFLMRELRNKNAAPELACQLAKRTNKFSLRTLKELINDVDVDAFIEHGDEYALQLQDFLPMITTLKKEILEEERHARYKQIEKELPIINSKLNYMGFILQKQQYRASQIERALNARHRQEDIERQDFWRREDIQRSNKFRQEDISRARMQREEDQLNAEEERTYNRKWSEFDRRYSLINQSNKQWRIWLATLNKMLLCPELSFLEASQKAHDEIPHKSWF